MLAVIAIGGRECHLLGMEAVVRDIGLELGPDARLTGVRTVVVDSTTKFAHGNDSCVGLRHCGPLAYMIVAPVCSMKAKALQGVEYVLRAEFASPGLSGHWWIV